MSWLGCADFFVVSESRVFAGYDQAERQAQEELEDGAGRRGGGTTCHKVASWGRLIVSATAAAAQSVWDPTAVWSRKNNPSLQMSTWACVKTPRALSPEPGACRQVDSAWAHLVVPACKPRSRPPDCCYQAGICFRTTSCEAKWKMPRATTRGLGRISGWASEPSLCDVKVRRCDLVLATTRTSFARV